MMNNGLYLMIWALLPAALEAQALSYGMTAKSGAVVDLTPAGRTAPVKVGTADPPVCQVGDLLYRSDRSELRHCAAADTWLPVSSPYTLPAATPTTLGGIKVGSGLTADGTGLLSVATSGYDVFDTTVVQWSEDFMSGPATGSSAHIGMNNLTFGTVLSATSAFSGGDQNHPSILTITSHATNADNAAVLKAGAFNGTTPQNTSRAVFQNKDWEFRVIFKLGNTSNARVRLGLGDQWSGVTGYNLVGLRYDTNSSYTDDTKNTSGSWVGQICASASGGCADGAGDQVVFNVAPDTNWHLFRISKSGSTVSMTIDSTTKTFCASGCNGTLTKLAAITADLSPVVVMGFETGSADTHSIDWMAFKASGLVRP